MKVSHNGTFLSAAADSKIDSNVDNDVKKNWKMLCAVLSCSLCYAIVSLLIRNKLISFSLSNCLNHNRHTAHTTAGLRQSGRGEERGEQLTVSCVKGCLSFLLTSSEWLIAHFSSCLHRLLPPRTTVAAAVRLLINISLTLE